MLYDTLIEFMENNNKSIKDIEFIQSYKYDDEGDITFHEVAIADFIQVAKGMDDIDIADTIKIVGRDWWIVTDTDEGYFEIYEMPKRPIKKINLAKELLLNPDMSAGLILGIEYEEE